MCGYCQFTPPQPPCLVNSGCGIPHRMYIQAECVAMRMRVPSSFLTTEGSLWLAARRYDGDDQQQA